ncbi:MAG: 1,4-beta-xylanase [Planctomycetes bacterium]|jgi:endo-1,4-beta-xylanase|nr:1,4-beta-xylanase [Planctomycetota bacterium]
MMTPVGQCIDRGGLRFLFCFCLLGSCLMMTNIAAETSREAATTTLKDRFAGKFLVGTCVSTGLLREGVTDENPTRRLIARQFNALTPENCMKWGHLHPEPGRYDFAAADELVAFAERHGHAVFGHTLIWHNQTPDWVFEDESGEPIGREALIERMRAHIHTVVGRYQGRIRAWDVVNEPLENKHDREELVRDSKWRQIIGDDYLDLAHRFAHEADPDATLIVNDYGLPNDAKRARMVKVVSGMRERGVPVHAIGLQGHWGAKQPSAEKLRTMLDELGAVGLPLHVTELDMNMVENKDAEADPYKDGLPADVAAAQATRYADWFTVFVENAERLERVCFWGPHDGHSWLNTWQGKRTNHPLLFDRNLNPKPAFDAVMNVKATEETEKDG